MRDAFGAALTYSTVVLIVGFFQMTIIKKNSEWMQSYFSISFFLLVIIVSGLMLSARCEFGVP